MEFIFSFLWLLRYNLNIEFSVKTFHWIQFTECEVANLNIVQRSWIRTFRLTSASLNRSFRPNFNSRMFSPQWFQWKVYGNQFKHFPIQWNIFSETYSRRFEPWKLLFSESYIFVWIAIFDQFKHKFSLNSISVKSFHRWKLMFKLTLRKSYCCSLRSQRKCVIYHGHS